MDNEQFKGRVVAVVERNGYDDSDWYATYAVEVDGGYEFKRALVGTTRFAWDGHLPPVDATDEVFAAYKAQREAVWAKYDAEQAEAKAGTVDKGKRVVVVAGRKYKGKSGEVFWKGEDQYKPSYGSGFKHYRVGVKFDDGEKGFLPADQCRVEGFDPEVVYSDEPSLGVMQAMLAAWPSPQYRAVAVA